MDRYVEVTRVPWLRKVVSDAMKTWIKEEMLWPQRMLIPAERPPLPGAVGGKPRFVLTEKELKAVLTEDPLLKAEQSLMSLKVGVAQVEFSCVYALCLRYVHAVSTHLTVSTRLCSLPIA